MSRDRFPLEIPVACASLSAGGQVFHHLTPLSETALAKESDMPDDGIIPSAVDTSMADAPNVGEVIQEINDNWQPIGSLVGRIVANALRQIEERDK